MGDINNINLRIIDNGIGTRIISKYDDIDVFMHNQQTQDNSSGKSMI